MRSIFFVLSTKNKIDNQKYYPLPNYAIDTKNEEIKLLAWKRYRNII